MGAAGGDGRSRLIGWPLLLCLVWACVSVRAPAGGAPASVLTKTAQQAVVPAAAQLPPPVRISLYGRPRTHSLARAVTTRARTYKLFNLRNRTANHASPDAVVHVPKGFNTRRPVRLIIFNHGLENTLTDVLDIWKLDRHMIHAPANSVLIMPEWAVNPRAYSKDAGRFHTPGFFRAMLEETLSRTPELSHYKFSNIKGINVIAYSGGYRAARSEIERNGLDRLVHSLTLLDALYSDGYFDHWLGVNFTALAAGRKQYHNFFFDTDDLSRGQLATMRRMADAKGIPRSAIYTDLNHPDSIMSSREITKHNIVIKRSRLMTPEFPAHLHMINLYFPRVLESLNQRTQRSQAAV